MEEEDLSRRNLGDRPLGERKEMRWITVLGNNQCSLLRVEAIQNKQIDDLVPFANQDALDTVGKKIGLGRGRTAIKQGRMLDQKRDFLVRALPPSDGRIPVPASRETSTAEIDHAHAENKNAQPDVEHGPGGLRHKEEPNHNRQNSDRKEEQASTTSLGCLVDHQATRRSVELVEREILRLVGTGATNGCLKEIIAKAGWLLGIEGELVATGAKHARRVLMILPTLWTLHEMIVLLTMG